ncbi:protein-tyrosine phosphatase [Geosporobacter subterraneus DSM 17957]|uniref:Protein-tyrosine phosphatase n=1 Tax=Geosporobacter subterraneus DSM 17957 TaxID=1121919 RepID=A0A1M6QHQ6_9FIRM|nr:low molecular weight protein arginine phosphatase [Geosporobacter subterraneus]SHK19789.1 protein-tyrosine phosphatase [Geosporobacter subterraneus DSM 17957]
MKTILFVCTGNTCRSSMAEALFRRMLENAGESLQGIRVISAGTAALKGQRASNNATQVMREWCIDLRHHQARPLTKELIQEADLILTMTRNHKQQVLNLDPTAEQKTYTLKEYTSFLGDDKEIILEIEKLRRTIQHKKAEFFREYEEEITTLRNRRIELQNQLQAVDDRIRELEIEMAKTIANEQRELVYLEDKLPSVDIMDPFGQPAWVYRECAKEIEEALKVVLQKLLEENN